MRWPFVHRARLEAAEYRADTATTYANTLVQAHNLTALENKRLLDQIIGMKQQGFSALPPKIAPQAGTSEDGYMKRELAAQKGPDPFIEGLLAEGKTLDEALGIRKQAQQDFKAGEM